MHTEKIHLTIFSATSLIDSNISYMWYLDEFSQPSCDRDIITVFKLRELKQGEFKQYTHSYSFNK